MKNLPAKQLKKASIILLLFFSQFTDLLQASPIVFPVGKDRDMEKASVQMFQNAIEMYKEKEFWKASRELIVILDFYSEFSKIDGVVFYIGECLYNMKMYKSAERLYQYLLENYKDSDYVAGAYLGLQKIQYSTGNYEQCIQFYNRLSEKHNKSNAMAGAHYYCGMSFYHTQDFDAAINAFSMIDKKSEYFDYGLYTTALAFLKKKDMKKAVQVFRAVLSLPVVNKERQDIIRTTHLTLGYLYYELGYYQQAIKHYAKIPVHDETYPEALLASAWAFIKLNDYQQAIISLNELVKRTDDPKYNEEAHFLLGQSYSELEFFDFAIQEYNYIIKRYPDKDNIDKRIAQVTEELEKQEKLAEALRVKLMILESDLMHTIPVDDHNEIPLYLKNEQDRVEKTQDNLAQKILDERMVFDELQYDMLKLREEIYVKQNRRHWRAYSEYGKARAYFLKTIP
ncbi:MAG: tetratricopeptide repeat protein [Deferribacteres bacterium]|nr:tetratricopeptide repeat protein [candidate division KSB1 bacterium]MCB9503977.1 tetratricopeptide repeat protein [Deferribacteres bacterium]